jgi:hypothetical protein
MVRKSLSGRCQNSDKARRQPSRRSSSEASRNWPPRTTTARRRKRCPPQPKRAACVRGWVDQAIPGRRLLLNSQSNVDLPVLRAGR